MDLEVEGRKDDPPMRPPERPPPRPAIAGAASARASTIAKATPAIALRTFQMVLNTPVTTSDALNCFFVGIARLGSSMPATMRAIGESRGSSMFIRARTAAPAGDLAARRAKEALPTGREGRPPLRKLHEVEEVVAEVAAMAVTRRRVTLPPARLTAEMTETDIVFDVRLR